MRIESRASGLLVPVSGKELEQRRRDADRQARDDYYRRHAACPRCFGRREAMCVTTMGWFGGRDPNDAICDCGWRGPVDTLVQSRPETTSIP